MEEEEEEEEEEAVVFCQLLDRSVLGSSMATSATPPTKRRSPVPATWASATLASAP